MSHEVEQSARGMLAQRLTRGESAKRQKRPRTVQSKHVQACVWATLLTIAGESRERVTGAIGRVGCLCALRVD